MLRSWESSSPAARRSGRKTGSGRRHANFTQNGMVNLPLGENVALRIVGSSDSLQSGAGSTAMCVLADGAVLTDGATGARPAGFYTAPLAETVARSQWHFARLIPRLPAVAPLRTKFPLPRQLMWQHTHQDGPSAVDVDGSPSHHRCLRPADTLRSTTPPSRKTMCSPWAASKSSGRPGALSGHFGHGESRRATLVSQDGTEENAEALRAREFRNSVSLRHFGGRHAASTGPGPTGPGVQ